MNNELEPIEAERLHDLEATIEAGLQTFIDVGTALAEIRDGKLYRQTHATWDDYLTERWGMSRAYAHRTIEAAEVVAMLPMGNIPKTERVARELAPLKDDPEAMVEVWEEVTVEHEEPTAKQVHEAVDWRQREHADRRKVRLAEAAAGIGDDFSGYAELLADERPQTRYQLGKKLDDYRVAGDWPPGLVAGICQAHDTTPGYLKKCWDYYRAAETAADFVLTGALVVKDLADTIARSYVYGDWPFTYHEALAGVPDTDLVNAINGWRGNLEKRRADVRQMQRVLKALEAMR